MGYTSGGIAAVARGSSEMLWVYGGPDGRMAGYWKSVRGHEREREREARHVLPITILSVFMPGPADAACEI